MKKNVIIYTLVTGLLFNLGIAEAVEKPASYKTPKLNRLPALINPSLPELPPLPQYQLPELTPFKKPEAPIIEHFTEAPAISLDDLNLNIGENLEGFGFYGGTAEEIFGENFGELQELEEIEDYVPSKENLYSQALGSISDFNKNAWENINKKRNGVNKAEVSKKKEYNKFKNEKPAVKPPKLNMKEFVDKFNNEKNKTIKQYNADKKTNETEYKKYKDAVEYNKRQALNQLNKYEIKAENNAAKNIFDYFDSILGPRYYYDENRYYSKQ